MVTPLMELLTDWAGHRYDPPYADAMVAWARHDRFTYDVDNRAHWAIVRGDRWIPGWGHAW